MPKILLRLLQKIIARNMKKKRKNKRDLISKLPDEVLHHILSFLDMHFVLNTSLLSRRWRNLWKSLPYLNFREEQVSDDDDDDDDYERGTPIYRSFDDFVTRVLSLQNGTNIHTFRLVLMDPETNSIDKCMPIAASRNIQVLDITTHYEYFVEFPPCIFSCESLTMLKLDMGHASNTDGSSKLPDSTSLPNLKTLHLISFVLYDGDDVEKFISRCPVLETLIMIDCMLERDDDVILTISAPQLKNFELDSLHLGDPYNPPYPLSSKVNVCAPNLICLKYTDFTFNLDFQENVPCLLKAEIGNVLDLERPEISKEEVESLLRCLRQFYNIRSLTVDMLLIELVCSARVGSERLLTPFCNLRVLHLSTTLSKCQSCAIAYLLDNCPNVETLVLEVREYSSCIKYSQDKLQWVNEDSTEDVEYYCEARMPSQLMLPHLRFVDVHILKGDYRRLGFLDLLLNNAVVLEKMKIFTYAGYLPTSFTRRFSLSALPKPSSIHIIAPQACITKFFFVQRGVSP